MTLFPVRNTNVSVLTICGKHGVLPFDLASGTSVNLDKEVFRLSKQYWSKEVSEDSPLSKK